MQYISTRGQAPALDFAQALLSGLARDGGLYVPQHYPQVGHTELTALAGKSFQSVAGEIIEGNITHEEGVARLTSKKVVIKKK